MFIKLDNENIAIKLRVKTGLRSDKNIEDNIWFN